MLRPTDWLGFGNKKKGSDLDARIESGEFGDVGSTKEQLTRPIRKALANDPLGIGALHGTWDARWQQQLRGMAMENAWPPAAIVPLDAAVRARQHCSCRHIPCAIMRDSWRLSPAAQLATSPQPHPPVLIDCPLKYFQLMHPCNSQRRRSPVPAQPLTCCSIRHPPALPTGRFFALQLAKLGREWRADASRRMPVARGDIREIVGQVHTLLKQGRVGGVACGNLISSLWTR